MRLLILLLLIVVGVWLVRRAMHRIAQREKGTDTAPKTQAAEELVRCAHCGLLLPRGEARQVAGAIYCSEEHAKLGQMRGPGR